MNTNLPGAAYDNKIYAKFSKNTIEKKAENKLEFCNEFGLKCKRRQMLLGIVLELSAKNNAKVLEKILPGLASLDICLAVRGVGSKEFQKIIGEFAEKNSEKITIVADEEDGLRKILAASDACFFFHSGVENEVLMQAALSYASLPIAPKSAQHIIEDYNPNQESGNGFLFNTNDSWSAFASVVRTYENFRFPYDWKNIQKSALNH